MPRPGDTCITAAGAAIDAALIARRRMREAKLAARIRHGDLTVVHVTREHEIERARLDPVERPREVAEQDAQVGVARERVRVDLGPAPQDHARMDACDPDLAAAQLEHDALVPQQDDGVEVAEVRRPRLRVAGDRNVVVAEHGVGRRRQASDELAQTRLTARMRQQVAGDRDEVRLPLGGPVDRSRSTACAPARRHAEVEVGEVRDPEAVELRRQPAQLELELAQPQPAGLEPAPPEGGGGRRPEKGTGAAPEGCRAGIHPTTHEMPQRRQTCAPLRLRASRAPVADRRCAA